MKLGGIQHLLWERAPRAGTRRDDCGLVYTSVLKLVQQDLYKFFSSNSSDSLW